MHGRQGRAGLDRGARSAYARVMDLSDLFRAVTMALLPMFILSFALVWWALHRGRLQGASVSELQRSIEALGKSRKKKKKQAGDSGDGEDEASGLADAVDPEKLDPVLGKWFAFGGGFYGLVALYTWLLIEWDDVANFLGGLGDIVMRFDIGSLISLAINLLIESIMNFVAAIAWPAYWLGEANNPWLWIALAYAGYWLGIETARRAGRARFGAESPDLQRTITGQDDDEPS